MVHAITKHGPVVTEGTDGFPVPEGFFCVSGKGKEAKRQAGELGSLPTAEFLRQAKHATGDYHDAMTDGMFQRWCTERLKPAFEARFGTDMKIILVLDNAS